MCHRSSRGVWLSGVVDVPPDVVSFCPRWVRLTGADEAIPCQESTRGGWMSRFLVWQTMACAPGGRVCLQRAAVELPSMMGGRGVVGATLNLHRQRGLTHTQRLATAVLCVSRPYGCCCRGFRDYYAPFIVGVQAIIVQMSGMLVTSCTAPSWASSIRKGSVTAQWLPRYL